MLNLKNGLKVFEGCGNAFRGAVSVVKWPSGLIKPVIYFSENQVLTVAL